MCQLKTEPDIVPLVDSGLWIKGKGQRYSVALMKTKSHGWVIILKDLKNGMLKKLPQKRTLSKIDEALKFLNRELGIFAFITDNHG